MAITEPGFPGGQQQCISAARALDRDPKFKVLDETDSCLDAAADALIQQALKHCERKDYIHHLAPSFHDNKRRPAIVVRIMENASTQVHIAN